MRFLKTSFFASVALSMLALTACESENLDVQPAANGVVQINATIGGLDNANTRVPQLDENGVGEFQVGDEWDLYVYDANDWYWITYFNQSFLYGYDQLYWDDISGQEITFTAVYPRVWWFDIPEQPSLPIEFDLLDYYTDLYYATTTVRRGEPVNLQFRHLMHNIEINLEPEGDYITEDDLNSLSVQMSGPVANVKLDWLTGEIDYGGCQYESKATWSANGRTASFIVAPQDLRYYIDLAIQMGVSSANYRIPIAYENGRFRLESGKKLTVNLKLHRNEPAGELGVTLSSYGINDWSNQGAFETDVILPSR